MRFAQRTLPCRSGGGCGLWQFDAQADFTVELSGGIVHQWEEFFQGGIGAEGLGIVAAVDVGVAKETEAEGFADGGICGEFDFELNFVFVVLHRVT